MLPPVQVESAVTLGPDQQTQIRQLLSQAKFTGEVSFIVNPRLIGGLKLSFSGHTVDLSLAYRLESLEEALTDYAG